MDTVTFVQIHDEAVRVSHGANIIGKGIHQKILSPAIGK